MISGQVQGVWYRATTKQKAEEQGITGWVKNTSDGKVEAIFEGEKNDIDNIIKWCHEGSKLSKVVNVQVNLEKYLGEFKGFNVVY